jgi:hypothetical protein
MIGDVIQWFNSNAGAVQGIAAIVTVVITALLFIIIWKYVRLTRDIVRLQVEPQLLISTYQESMLLVRNRGVERLVNLSIELIHFFLIKTPAGWQCPRFNLMQPNVASRSQLDIGDTWEVDVRKIVEATVEEAKRHSEPKILIIHVVVTVHRPIDLRESSFRKRFMVIPGIDPQRSLIVDMYEEFLPALMPDFPEHEIERFIRSFNRPLQPPS